MEIKRNDCGTRMSRSVEYAGFVFVSGHAANDDSGDMKAQAAETLQKLEASLKSAGSDKNHILAATVYLRDITQKAEFDAVWDQWVTPGTAPTRACVEAKLGNPKLLAEVVLTAAKL